MAPSLLSFYLFLSLPLCSSPPPPLFLPTSLPPPLPVSLLVSLPTSSFHPNLPLLLPHHLILLSHPHLPLFQSLTRLPILALSPFSASFPPLRRSYLAFPQQQQMRFPLFTQPPVPASLHLFLPPSLALCIHHSCPSGLCSALIRSLSVAFSPRQCLPFSLGLCK